MPPRVKMICRETKKTGAILQHTWLWENVLYANKGLPAYLPLMIIVVIFLVAAIIESLLPTNDVSNYECYATVFWLGKSGLANLPAGQCTFLQQSVQFHSFPLEYPPFSLVLFSIPLIIPVISYPLGFGVTMALLVALIYWMLLRFGPHGSAPVFGLYLLFSSFATALTRFDIFPAGMTVLCLILGERKHWSLAYIVLAIAVLTKLYPIVLFPLLFVAEQNDRNAINVNPGPFHPRNILKDLWKIVLSFNKFQYKNSLIFLGLVAGITGLFGLLNFNGAALGSTAFFLARPFQVESSGSVFLWLASFWGIPISREFSFGSLNVLSPISDWVSQGSLFVLYSLYIVIVLMLVLKKFELKQAFLATLMVVLATSKVFSPQYLIWLVPLLAFSTNYRKPWLVLWGSISLVTDIIFPIFYIMTAWVNILNLPSMPGFMQVVACRNVIFVFTTLAYLFNWFSLR